MFGSQTFQGQTLSDNINIDQLVTLTLTLWPGWPHWRHNVLVRHLSMTMKSLLNACHILYYRGVQPVLCAEEMYVRTNPSHTVQGSGIQRGHWGWFLIGCLTRTAEGCVHLLPTILELSLYTYYLQFFLIQVFMVRYIFLQRTRSCSSTFYVFIFSFLSYFWLLYHIDMYVDILQSCIKIERDVCMYIFVHIMRNHFECSLSGTKLHAVMWLGLVL